MNFLKPLCDKLRRFKPPLLGAGPIIPAGSSNCLTWINVCEWWTSGQCLGSRMEGLRLSVLYWVSTSSRICISPFSSKSVFVDCQRITPSALSSLLEVKIRQINQSWCSPTLRRFFSSPEGGEGAGAQQELLRLHGWSVYLPGRHWKALRMDELMDASRDENESCQSLNDIQALLYVMGKHPVAAVPQV